MADAYSGIYSLIEEKMKATLAADAWLATVSATRLSVKTFADEPTADEEAYDSHLLPAIEVEAVTGGGGEDAEIDAGGLDTVHVSVNGSVAVITEAASYAKRRTLAKDIAARVERVLRDQNGSNQMDGLDDVVPGAVGGSIQTTVSGTVIQDSGQDRTSSIHRRTVAFVFWTVEIDIDGAVS